MMQLYGGGYQNAIDAGRITDTPRLNFNNVWRAFVTIYVVQGTNFHHQHTHL
jgi:hypothetical protein